MTATRRAMGGAVIGLVVGAILLGSLHLYAGERLAPVSIAEAAAVYAAFLALTTALGAATGYLHIPAPRTEPTRGDVIRREVGVAMRNGALIGVGWALLRLGVMIHGYINLPLWWLALYAGGMLAVFTLGLGAFGLIAGWMKARDLR